MSQSKCLAKVRPEPASLEPRPPAAETGFTLLEILVAFAVLALLLGAQLQAFSGGLRAAGSAEQRTMGVLLAKSQIARLEAAGDLSVGSYTGVLPDGYSWRAVVTALEPMPINGQDLLPVFPYKVVLTIRWTEDATADARAQSQDAAAAVSLTTLILGAPP